MKARSWPRVSFGEALADKTAAGHKLQQSNFKVSGKIPIVDQGQSEIAGFSDDESLAWKHQLPVLVFGDHTRAIKYIDFPFILGADGVKVLVPREDLSARFAYYYFKGIDIPSSGYSRHFRFLKQVNVPLPPLPEQERIAKLLDEAEELRKLHAHAERYTADLIPALFHEMFGDPGRSLPVSTLGELVQDFRYGTSNKATGDGKPTLRIPNVVEQAVNLDNLKFVPVTDSEFDRLRLKDGDLLFVRTNGNADYVGRCAIFDAQAVNAAGYNADEFIYASYLIRVRLQVENVLPLFIQHYLATPEGCRALRARSKTSAGQFNINTEGLGSLQIPVPPLPLQEEFAKWVTAIRELEAKQAASRERLDALFQSMLHRAFRGEL